MVRGKDVEGFADELKLWEFELSELWGFFRVEFCVVKVWGSGLWCGAFHLNSIWWIGCFVLFGKRFPLGWFRGDILRFSWCFFLEYLCISCGIDSIQLKILLRRIIVIIIHVLEISLAGIADEFTGNVLDAWEFHFYGGIMLYQWMNESKCISMSESMSQYVCIWIKPTW